MVLLYVHMYQNAIINVFILFIPEKILNTHTGMLLFWMQCKKQEQFAIREACENWLDLVNIWVY